MNLTQSLLIPYNYVNAGLVTNSTKVFFGGNALGEQEDGTCTHSFGHRPTLDIVLWHYTLAQTHTLQG